MAVTTKAMAITDPVTAIIRATRVWSAPWRLGLEAARKFADVMQGQREQEPASRMVFTKPSGARQRALNLWSRVEKGRAHRRYIQAMVSIGMET